MSQKSLAIPFVLALLGTIVLSWSDPVSADNAPVVLTVQVSQTADPIELTDADLMAMDQQSFVTSTLWTKQDHQFSGPSLHDVLVESGAEPTVPVKLIAANDYAATLEPEMIGEEYPIIANRIDGAPYSIREKGPLWVIFPFDKGPEYNTELHYGLSVWQLTDIVLEAPGTPSESGA